MSMLLQNNTVLEEAKAIEKSLQAKYAANVDEIPGKIFMYTNISADTRRLRIAIAKQNIAFEYFQNLGNLYIDGKIIIIISEF